MPLIHLMSFSSLQSWNLIVRWLEHINELLNSYGLNLHRDTLKNEYMSLLYSPTLRESHSVTYLMGSMLSVFCLHIVLIWVSNMWAWGKTDSGFIASLSCVNQLLYDLWNNKHGPDTVYVILVNLNSFILKAQVLGNSIFPHSITLIT